MRIRLHMLVGAISTTLLSAGVVAEDAQQAEREMELLTVTGKYTVNKSIDTATGLGLTLRETPQSVTVFTADRIRDQNLNNIIEAVNNATGISSRSQDNVRSSMRSRGFEITNYQIDGVPLSWSLSGDSGETVTDISIYERIEFVRGATGLLTGVGDPSASINLVRKKADSRELTGYLDVSIGRWNKRQVTADVATGLNASGSIRGRVVARYLDSESYQDFFEVRKDVLYGVLEADLTDNTLLRVGGSYQNRDPQGATWGAVPALYQDGSQIDWDVSKTAGLDWTEWETTNENYFVSLNHYFTNGWQIKLNYNKIEYEKDTKLVLLSGAVNRQTGGGLKAQRYRSFGSTEQESFDLQLSGDYQLFGQRHDFVFGALRSEQEGTSSTRDPDPNVGCADPDSPNCYDSISIDNFYQWGSLPEPKWTAEETVRDINETEQTGYYASTRLSITDRFKVIAGARIASWERQRTNYGTVSDYGDDDVVIPYFGALFDVNDQHRVYASYTEIFTPQNNQDASGDYLDPLTGISTELGLKSAFFNQRLQTSIAVFRTEQDNLAVLDPTFEQTPTQRNAYYAAQGTVSDGFELEVVGEIIDGWNISAGYSQFEAEDADDNEVMTDAPRKLFKLFTTYQLVNTLPALTIGGGVNWQSESYSEGSPGQRITQDAYALVNLMARYEITGNLNLQLNVENLFDKKYYDYVTAGRYNQYRYGTPRNATLSLSYNF